MRVIAGSARSLRLKTLDGMDTRPTTDRIKETLFNMIGPSMFDCVFLDLFAGSGGIGIEALSRGAREAVFVENNPKAMMCVKDNLKFTKLEGKAVTLTTDVMNALYKLEGEKIIVSNRHHVYWVEKDDKMKQFRNFKQLAKIYSKHRAEVEKYIEDNKVNFEDVDQIVKLCAYADSLK